MNYTTTTEGITHASDERTRASLLSSAPHHAA